VVSALLCAEVAFAQTAGTGNTGGAGGAAPAPAPAPAPPAPPPAAAPPAPAPLVPTKIEPPKPSSSGATSALGISPSAPQLAGGTNITSKEAESLTPSIGGSSDEWRFDFHGYMRAPLRVSFGPPEPLVFPSIYSPPAGTADPRPAGSYYDPTNPAMRPPLPSGTEWHSPPRVPGSNYTTWEYTNTVPGPWAQLNFSYGNSRAMATVVVDAYNQTDGSYRQLQAQQGIDQAFLTLNFPELLGDYGTFTWNIGSFQNRYGTAGKYDGGMYETYLFGRTHISGETMTANLTNLDAAGNWSLAIEHGFGAKIDLVPFLNNQNYQVFQNVPVGGANGSPYTSDRSPDYLPYSGPVPQGSTYVHHAHIGAKYQKLWTLGAHYLFTWTPDDNWHPINSRLPNVSDQVPRYKGPIQGSMQIMGLEARLSGGVFGDGYIGYSHIDARNINALAEAIEVLHSYGGGQFKQNYFGKTFDPHMGIYTGPQNETGTLDNISLQYSFSFGQYARYPEDFWGDGPDLVLTGFGLLTIVNSKAPETAGGAANTAWDMSTKKLKYGGDALYTPLSWLGFGVRFDVVQPDLDGAYARTAGVAGGKQLNFETLNLRAVIKTAFVTHETVNLRYAHYFLGSAALPPYPYNWVQKADADLLSLDAAMWW
jgi:hypothetical protein